MCISIPNNFDYLALAKRTVLMAFDSYAMQELRY